MIRAPSGATPIRASRWPTATYLAWNRTALALIGGGLAAGQLLDFDSRATRLLVALPPIRSGSSSRS